MINNITKNWSDIVGKKYEKLCYPKLIRFTKAEKTASLTIAVYNPSIGFFLESNSEVIIERIATLYGFKSVAKIIIKQEPKNISQNKIERKLSSKQENSLKENIKNISDQNLAETLEKLGKNIIGSKPE